MTKTAEREIRKQLAALRGDRKRWLRGEYNPWGMPWCAGPGAPYHQPPGCEGCAGREWAQEHAVPITAGIERLEALLPPVQVAVRKPHAARPSETSHQVEARFTPYSAGSLVVTGVERLTGTSDFDIGFLVGLLVGEGSFTGDSKQPCIQLKMNVRHDQVFNWLCETFPGSPVCGPYVDKGRYSQNAYYQWLCRGRHLENVIFPLLDRYMSVKRDFHSRARFDAMAARYGLKEGLREGGP